MLQRKLRAFAESREMGAVQHLVGGDRGIVTRLAAAFVSSILAVTTFSSSALGAPTKDPGVLMERAYILWAGLCAYCDEPIRLGYGAESAHRPERMHFSLSGDLLRQDQMASMGWLGCLWIGQDADG